MVKLSKISLILMLLLSLSAIVLAGSNIYTASKIVESEIVIYPNPVLDKRFTVSSEQDILELLVLNVLGQVVYVQEDVQEKKISVELETSDKGIYLVQIRTGDGKLTTKRVLFK